MELVEELLPGTWLVRLPNSADDRGRFVKTYSQGALARLGLDFELRETFYSQSAKNVVRGMHFQRPPHEHVKLVHCAAGSVLDVLLDLRAGAGYGQVCSTELHANAPSLVIIPAGVAHGFRALQNDSLVLYQTSLEHAPTHDDGLRWDSFGFDWGVQRPTLSSRDERLLPFTEFRAPFTAP
jgi:dTDP-4-dehydrorhamnose 3,5-epimerase/CDP-3, 6-dideoxy-D-glycero-D-glycero-4-hexulose-5-epimerase